MVVIRGGCLQGINTEVGGSRCVPRPGVGGSEVWNLPPFMAWVGGSAVSDHPFNVGLVTTFVLASLSYRPHSLVLFCYATWPVPLWVWSTHFRCGQAAREHCKSERHKKWLDS